MRPILAPINDQRQALLTERLHSFQGLRRRTGRPVARCHSRRHRSASCGITRAI